MLPFKSLSADSSDNTSPLAYRKTAPVSLPVEWIRVVAHTSARALSARAMQPREMAAALGVAGLLEGSVRRAGDQIRVTARLVDARTGAQLWAETMIGPSVTCWESSERSPNISPPHSTPHSHQVRKLAWSGRRSVDPEAYRLYLLGRHHFARYTPPAMRRSIEYFGQAIARDSGFAPAYAACAEVPRCFSCSGEKHPNDLMPAARAAAQQSPRSRQYLGRCARRPWAHHGRV